MGQRKNARVPPRLTSNCAQDASAAGRARQLGRQSHRAGEVRGRGALCA